jgi:hypothetical protein
MPNKKDPALQPNVVLERQGKVRSRDLPQLLETISCGDAKSQKAALELLCPCRNPRYDLEVWRAIFAAYAEATNPGVRDQAGHAIGTLRERAKDDPRSQELIARLQAEGLDDHSLTDAVPVWIPNLRGNGLYIPRYEPPRRSKANRRH